MKDKSVSGISIRDAKNKDKSLEKPKKNHCDRVATSIQEELAYQKMSVMCIIEALLEG